MNKKHYIKLSLGFLLINLFGIDGLNAQSLKTKVPLNDLSAFVSAPKNWGIAGNVQADLEKVNELDISKGQGILVNQMNKSTGNDLFFNLQHGDIDLEMDYMVSKAAKSGIFFQGRYKVQLSDSWGKVKPKSNDNGGISERWDDNKPEGQKAYEGYAPRQNVSRAPGLWQHIKVSFQAPRFDEKGLKIANAKIVYVWLNGVLIQENVELSGPTQGASDNKESLMGPLRIEGTQGNVAFKNISYNSFDKPHPVVSQLKYSVYKGNFLEEPDFKNLKPVAEGTPLILTSNEVKLDNEFAMKYTGVINIIEPGDYTFKLNVQGGKGALRINGLKVIDTKEFRGEGTVKLPAGKLPLELYYNKNVDWAKAALGLTVSGPGIREYLLSDANVVSLDAVDPILIDATKNTILRSFTDLPGNYRVSHAVAVGSPEQLHYTYDLDNGMIVQLWRGSFLDATPMWHERGDGSSRPAGSVQFLGKPALVINKLADKGIAWSKDTTGTGFRPKGYTLDANKVPTFKYMIYGTLVTDASKLMPEGQGIRREISLQTPVSNAYVLLATGNKLQEMKNGLYIVEDSYYIKLENQGAGKPILREAGGKQELLVPIKDKLTYSIIF